jgi:hypothetical protein
MRTTGQRTNVHGSRQAAREWRRIVDLSWRHGLAALPATRSEFAIGLSPRRCDADDPSADDRATDDRVAAQARHALDAAETGVLYIDGALLPDADDVLLVDANGTPQFSCSSWSTLAQAARADRSAVLVISHAAPRSSEVTVTFAGALIARRRHEVDRQWFEEVAMVVESVSIAPARGPARRVLSGATYRRYCAAADEAAAVDGCDDPAS